MKTNIIMLALVALSAGLSAQDKTEHKVRIRKVENINGVEKITDTTMLVSAEEWKKMNDRDMRLAPVGLGRDSVKVREFTIKMREPNGPELDEHMKKREMLLKEGDQVRVVKMGTPLSEEEKEELKRAIDEAGGPDGKAHIVIREEIKDGKDGKEQSFTKVVIIKKCKVVKPDEKEEAMLNKTTGVADNKVALTEMNFYPNPSDGRFNLSFNLPEEANTEVSVLDNQGKLIYNEKLGNFSGDYNKSIDISSNPKGIYFVKVSQGAHSTLKKIVLE